MTTVTIDRMAYIVAHMLDSEKVEAGVYAALVSLKRRVSVYPPAMAKRPPQPFKTARSRRYFFYAKSAGIINLPYRRGSSPGSQAMSKRWALTAVGMNGRLGNSAGYAPLVIGPTRQSNYMRSLGWQPIDRVTQRYADETTAAFVTGLYNKVKGTL